MKYIDTNKNIKNRNANCRKGGILNSFAIEKDVGNDFSTVNSIRQTSFNANLLNKLVAVFLLLTIGLGATFIQSNLAANKPNEVVAKLSQIPTNTPRTIYVTNDSLGSPRVLTDESGNEVSRRDFLPFGEEVTRSNYGTDSIRQKFTGYERDTESGLDFAQARFYNYNHGRFTSTDPLFSSGKPNNPQTWNRYAYVGNNPLNITDPLGLDWYYNKSQGRHRWYNDGETAAEGYERVVGSNNFVYYAGEGTGYVALNPTANKWQTFETQDAALGRVNDIFNCLSCQPLADTVAEQSKTKGKVVGGAAALGVVVGTGIGAGMVLTGTAAGAGITTLGLTEAGAGAAASATTTAGATASVAEVESVIARGLANPQTRGLTKQLIDHQKKLLEYVKNPSSMDNKGFLKNAPTQEIRDKIYTTRVQNLTHQIKNFYEQIKSQLP